MVLDLETHRQVSGRADPSVAGPGRHVHVQLLGQVAVDVDGVRYVLTGRRVGDFLAYLSLANPDGCAVHAMAADLWPGVSPSQQRTNLRHMLHTLRDRYPEVALCVRRDSGRIAWAPTATVTVDARDWLETALSARDEEALQAALATGDSHLAIECAWAAPWRARLEAADAEVRGRLIDLQVRRRAFDEAYGVAVAPWQRDGKTPVDALRLLRLALLSGGVQRVQEVAAALAASEPRCAEAEAAVWRQEAERLQALASPRAPVPRLLDRTREWSRLLDAWDTAQSRRPTLVFVQGPAGIGKSTLLRAWQYWLEVQHITVISDGALDAPAIGSWAALQGDGTGFGAPPAQGAALGSGDVPTPTRAPAGSGHTVFPDRWGRYQQLAERCWKSTPGVLLLDNLEAAATDAWDWLQFLLRAPRREVLLVVVAARDDPATVRRRQALFQAVHATAACRLVALQPLDDRASLQLVEWFGPLPDTDVQSILQWSAGHPLALVHGAQAAAQRMRPVGLSTRVVIQERVAALPAGERRLLAAMTVVHHSMPVAFWRRLVPTLALHAFDRLKRAGLVAEDGEGRLSLAHAEIQAALRETVDGHTWRLWARRAARIASTEFSETPADLVATLFAAADDRGGAATWWMRVVDDARAALRFSDAAAACGQLEQLAAPPGRLHWALERARLLEESGDRVQATLVYRNASETALAAGDYTGLAGARAGLARCLAAQGEWDTAQNLLDENLAYFRTTADAAGVARTLVEQAQAAAVHGALRQAREWAEEARALAEMDQNPLTTALAEGQLGYIAWESGDPTEAIHYWRNAESHGAVAGDQLTVMRALGDIGVALLETGHLTTAVEYQWQKATLAHRHHLLEDLALALGNLGVAYQDAAMWATSTRCFTAASRLALGQGDRRILAILTNDLAYTWAQEGRVAAAETLWASALTLAEQLPLPRSIGQFALHWAEALWTVGELSRMPPLLRKAWRVRNASPEWDRARWRALMARLQVATGRLTPENARQRVLADFDRWLVPESRALLRVIAWELTQNAQDWEAAMHAVEPVWARHPHHVWQRYYAALTGVPPALPDLPPPPDWLSGLEVPPEDLARALVAYAAEAANAPTVRIDAPLPLSVGGESPPRP